MDQRRIRPSHLETRGPYMYINPLLVPAEIYLVFQVLSPQWVPSSDVLLFLAPPLQITQTNCLSHIRGPIPVFCGGRRSSSLVRQGQMQVALPPRCIAYPSRTAASAPGYGPPRPQTCPPPCSPSLCATGRHAALQGALVINAS